MMKSVVRTLKGQDSPQFIPLERGTPTTTVRKAPTAADSPALSSTTSISEDHHFDDEHSPAQPKSRAFANSSQRNVFQSSHSAFSTPSQGGSEDEMDPAFAPLTPDPFASPNSNSTIPSHQTLINFRPSGPSAFQLPLSAQLSKHANANGHSSRATMTKHFLQLPVAPVNSETTTSAVSNTASTVLKVDDNPFAPVSSSALLKQQSAAHLGALPSAAKQQHLARINSDSVIVVKKKEPEPEEIDDTMVPIDYSKRSFGCEVRDPNAPLNPQRNRIMGMMAAVIIGALIVMIIIPLLVVYLK